MPEPSKVCGDCGGELPHGTYVCVRVLKARVESLEARVGVRQDVAVGPTEGA
jgi:hypothetical protein